MAIPDVATVRDPNAALDLRPPTARRAPPGRPRRAPPRVPGPIQSRPVPTGEDDVRHIDWNVTARSLEPHVWRPRAEHELEAWVLVDETASMARSADPRAATSPPPPRRHARRRPGNRAGLARLGADGMRWAAPAPASATARRLVRSVGERMGADSAPGAAPSTSPRPLCPRARPRPGVRVVVTDLLEPDGRTDRPFPWEPAVRRLAARHDVVVVEVLDPRELDLPDVGLVLDDPETGRQREVWTSPRLRPPMPRPPPGTASTSQRGARLRRRARPAADRLRLGPRPRPLHPHPPARAAGHPLPEAPMTFLSPWWLLLLLLVLALVVAYLLAAGAAATWCGSRPRRCSRTLRPARPGGVGTPLPPRSSWPCRPSPSPSHVPR